MTLDQYASLAEIFGLILVVVTLVFLALQTRQNTKAINATITQGNITGFNELNSMLAANPQLAEILDRGSADPSRLTATEANSYTWIVRSFINLFLNLYDQFLQGTCPEPLWRRHEMELQTFAKSPGVREFLKGNSYYHQLIKHIDSLPPARDHRIGFNLDTHDGQRQDA